MAEITDLRAQLDRIRAKKAEEAIVTFEKRGLKLETEADAAEVCAEIDGAARVDGIIFTGNTIGTDAAKKIGESLEKRKEFKRALWSDMFTGRSKSEIPPALIGLCRGIQTAGAQLVELDLSDNAFGPNGARGIEGFLRSPSAYSLEILKLNNNGLGITGAKMIAAALNDCYESSVAAGTPLKLRVFVGGRNRLENEGATALAECFKKIGTMEEITVPQNGIYSPGISALAAAFAANVGIRVINLSDNTLTETGASAIAEVLPALKSLEKLNLSDCLLKPEGGMILARALTNSCPELEELLLSGNEFDAEAGLTLIESLKDMEKLGSIDMNGNEFSEDGIESIIDLATQFGMGDYLGSFSDDEGLAGSDDGGDGGDGGGGDDDDEKDEETPHQNGGDTGQQQINGMDVTGRTALFLLPPSIARKPSLDGSSVNTSREMLHPHAASLFALEESVPEEMRPLLYEHLKNPDDVITFIFGVASLIDSGNRNNGITEKAQKCCEAYLKQAFESKDHGQLTNELLEHLGVIKSENMVNKPKNVSGVLTMLSNAVEQDWFPAESRSMLAFVLEKRGRNIDADQTTLTRLMNGLHVEHHQ